MEISLCNFGPVGDFHPKQFPKIAPQRDNTQTKRRIVSMPFRLVYFAVWMMWKVKLGYMKRRLGFFILPDSPGSCLPTDCAAKSAIAFASPALKRFVRPRGTNHQHAAPRDAGGIVVKKRSSDVLELADLVLLFANPLGKRRHA